MESIAWFLLPQIEIFVTTQGHNSLKLSQLTGFYFGTVWNVYDIIGTNYWYISAV